MSRQTTVLDDDDHSGVSVAGKRVNRGRSYTAAFSVRTRDVFLLIDWSTFLILCDRQTGGHYTNTVRGLAGIYCACCLLIGRLALQGLYNFVNEGYNHIIKR